MVLRQEQRTNRPDILDEQEASSPGLCVFRNKGLSGWITWFILGTIEIVAADVPTYRRLRKGRWYRVQNMFDSGCFEWVHESDLFCRGLEWDEKVVAVEG